VDTDKHTAYTTLHTVLETVLRLLAPFVPFTAEELYRSLAGHADPDVSVHLQDFPGADASRQDTELERRMATTQQVVSLGRSLRQDTQIKTRQPLGRLLIHSTDDRARGVLEDATLVGYVASELNVKQAEALDDPRTVAELAAKANYRALGPRFGKQSPQWAKAIEAMTAEQVLQFQEQGTITLTVDDRAEPLGFEEVQVRQAGIAPFAATGQAGLTVALDTTIDDALRAEGLAREIINKVQNLRKKSGLEVSDRIQLVVSGAEPARQAVRDHADRIQQETLAVSLETGDAEGELAHRDSFRIDDSEITIMLAKS
jgi:isoleucyl-tRNA synthetase